MTGFWSNDKNWASIFFFWPWLDGIVSGHEQFLVADTRLYTLPCRSVRPSVGPSVGASVGHIFELRAVFALLLLPNRPRLDCRVSGLVRHQFNFFYQFAILIRFYSISIRHSSILIRHTSKSVRCISHTFLPFKPLDNGKMRLSEYNNR